MQHVPQHVKKLVERAKMAGLAPAKNLNGGRWEDYRQRCILSSALPAGKQVHGGLGQKRTLIGPKAGEVGVSGALLQKRRDIEAATFAGRTFSAGSIVAASIAPPSFTPSRLLSAHNEVITASEPASEPEFAAALLHHPNLRLALLLLHHGNLFMKQKQLLRLASLVLRGLLILRLMHHPSWIVKHKLLVQVARRILQSVLLPFGQNHAGRRFAEHF